MFILATYIKIKAMSGIIYYPFISLPQRAWTYRQLLYYDEISTIVPTEYFDNPVLYPAHMQELIREGLVIPQNFSYDYDIQNELYVQFIRYLKSNNLSSRRAAFSKPHCLVLPDRAQMFNTKFRHQESLTGGQIYNSKFGPAILDELQSLDLARQEDNGIYLVEKKTAFELMQFLTSLIGDRIEAYPTTDIFPYFGIKSQEEIIIRNRNEKRDVLLKKVMPLPEDIDFRRLMRFKERHHDLLRRFRVEIESIVLNEEICIDTARFENAVDRIEDQRDEIIRRMEEFNYQNIFRYSVHGMIPFAVAAMEREFNRNVLVTGSLTLLSAIATAISNLSHRRIDNTSGMKYLALANRTFRTEM